MIEHWWEYLPSVWYIPEVRWQVTIGVLLLMAISMAAGYKLGRKSNKKA